MLDRASPFVLLDDARAEEAAMARLYRDPIDTIACQDPAKLANCLSALRYAQAHGLHAAGWIAYDAGALAEPPSGAAGTPLLWFGLFEHYEQIAPERVPSFLPDPAGAWAGSPKPLIDRTAYAAAFDRVKAYIAAGDIYQANLTFQAEVPVAGDPLALYARIRGAAAAGWGGIVHDGARTLLSFSPEMFVRLDGRRIEARPMKGTAARDSDPALLAQDSKQRAENLMIVDLIRNDLSRIAAPASVAVPELFAVETYPTILQMTSTVTAELAESADAVSLLEAAFPCGSITGAPKLRAMAIAAEVEAGPRGLYTGAIGRLDAGGGAAFNVAIRTLVVEGESATIGLGSGVVADSDVGAEWAECLAKGGFIPAACPRFDLLETMPFDPHEGFVDLERHLTRMKRSAEALGFAFDRHDCRNELQAATFRLRDPARIRVRLSPTGKIAIEVRPAPDEIDGIVAPIVPLPVAPDDFRLRHKTSERSFYDDARGRHIEILFARPDGLLTEGSFTNLFVRRADGKLLTPPASRGLLPGVLRERLLSNGEAIEHDLAKADLRDGFFLGNALRGLIAARLP
ncbi:aminodeoxychorismate synthase component I [Sphingomonas oryzagri]